MTLRGSPRDVSWRLRLARGLVMIVSAINIATTIYRARLSGWTVEHWEVILLTAVLTVVILRSFRPMAVIYLDDE